jgi:anti-sigma B factor antagonist
MAQAVGRTEVRTRRIDEAICVLEVRGEVTASSEKALTDGYGECSGAATRAVIVDFTALEYMNSGGIGLLVTMLVRANRQKQRLLAFGLNEHYRQIFELTRLDEAIGIHGSEAQALVAARARSA